MSKPAPPSSSTERVPLPPSHSCFVCGRDNQHGLALRFDSIGNQVVTQCELGSQYAGFDRRTHGGIVAALLDEAMGWATVLATGRFTYTVELNVRYRAPVPTETPLAVAGWVERDARRLLFAAATIKSSEQQLLASATAKFMKVSEAETKEIAGSLVYSPGSWRFADE